MPNYDGGTTEWAHGSLFNDYLNTVADKWIISRLTCSFIIRTYVDLQAKWANSKRKEKNNRRKMKASAIEWHRQNTVLITGWLQIICVVIKYLLGLSIVCVNGSRVHVGVCTFPAVMMRPGTSCSSSAVTPRFISYAIKRAVEAGRILFDRLVSVQTALLFWAFWSAVSYRPEPS